MKRVLVCGGRRFVDRECVKRVLDRLHRVELIACIIHGDQTGADTIAKEWAIESGVPHQPFPAEWLRYGRAAGPIRNRRMILRGKPDLVIAFPGGEGTADMVKKAMLAAIPVYPIDFKGEASEGAG